MEKKIKKKTPRGLSLLCTHAEKSIINKLQKSRKQQNEPHSEIHSSRPDRLRHGPFLAASSKPRTLLDARCMESLTHCYHLSAQVTCPARPPQTATLNPSPFFALLLRSALSAELTKVYLYPYVAMPQFNGFSSYFWYFVVVVASSQLATGNLQLAIGNWQQARQQTKISRANSFLAAGPKENAA